MAPGPQRAAAILLVFLLGTGNAAARPAHKKALADFFGPLLADRLNDCRTCHRMAQPTPEAHEHNPFGARLKAVRAELRKAGKKTDIASRLEAIADEDSDGDGVPNLVELLTGHNPGDPNDRPTAAELAAAGKLRTALRAARSAYRWTPFEPVRRPAVPAVRSAAWLRNPIDAFIAAEHEKHGLRPRPEAPRAVLLRRVYLDLIGLPPTRGELLAFLADDSPDAYEKVVDRLLASPQYGERWGRHWMDVWRYSDWAGFGQEVRDSQRHLWHWRDWIIESLNQDKGYDRMVQEMLAGDELAPTDPATLRATGFLVRNWYKFNRQVWLDRTVEHTAKAFLGLTLNCARCHDHKYDPLAQREYYAFRAFFEPHNVRTDRVPGQPDLLQNGLPRVYDADLNAPTYRFIHGNDKNPDRTRPIPPTVPVALGGPPVRIQPLPLPLTASVPAKRDFEVRETIRASEQKATKARAACATARQALDRAEQALAAISAADREAWSALRAARVRLETNRLTALAGWRQALAACQKTADGMGLAQQVVEAARDACELAERNRHLAEADHAQLLATLRAEGLEDTGQKDSAAWQEAARQAHTAQQHRAWAEAQRDHFAARLAVKQKQAAAASPKAAAELKAARDRLAAATARLARVEQDARRPASTAYARRNVPAYPRLSSGRRLALARWITDRQNPLAARVAMNHVWLRHFGKALVPTVFDFGQNGRPASHPALLDWLAAEFMDSGWSLKHMHRLLVTSQAYRMDSAVDARSLARDPDNRYLWRMNPHRLEAEAVRDSVLHVAGRLDPALGGPDLDYSLGMTSGRRSLYFRHAAEKEMEFLKLFDAANVAECYQRSETIVPQQALALENSTLVLEASRQLAGRLLQELGGQTTPAAATAFVRLSFEHVLARPPTAAEQAACVRFLAEQGALLRDRKRLTPFPTGDPAAIGPAADPDARARENLIHVLLNHHDFVTVR